MSEEKKKDEAAEAPKAAKEKAPQEAPAKEHPAPKPHAGPQGHPHGQKVGKMTLAELDEAIARCEKQMGGLWSRHGRSLADRKAALLAQAQPARLKKAA